MIRFVGLLIIPFIYGFSYIFAFYDPFSNVHKLKMTVITESDSFLGDEIGKSLSKSKNIFKMGDVDMTLKMDHIYSNDKNLENEKKESYVSLTINGTNELDRGIAELLAIPSTVDSFKKLSEMIKKFTNPVDNPKDKSKTKSIDIILNNKKNYLLLFGIDAGSSMYSGTKLISDKLFETISSEKYKEHLSWEIVKNKNNIVYGGTLNKKQLEKFNEQYLVEKKKIDILMNRIKNANPLNGSQDPILIESHMGEHNKYGYGLAPFFISVAMWIGSMSLTFAIHRKIYNNNITPGMRYLAKWLILVFGTTIQATILMTSLYFIGFDKLGLDHWFLMYGGSIFIGLIFVSIIQAIRFGISGRIVSIFTVIFLLVLQMTSAGGLFPIETQSGFYQVLNKILPMGRTVTIIRELSYQTDWSNVFMNLSGLLVWLFIVPIGVVANHYKTLRYYAKNNIGLLPTVEFTKVKKRSDKRGNL